MLQYLLSPWFTQTSGVALPPSPLESLPGGPNLLDQPANANGAGVVGIATDVLPHGGTGQLAPSVSGPSADSLSPCATLRPRLNERRIEKLGERVYCAVGFALSNVTMIATKHGKIIVDATESVQAAREVRAAFDKLLPGPVQAIIYTHSHPDHFLGATAFHGPSVPVWAHANFHEEIRSQVGTLSRTLCYRASKQFGDTLPAARRAITGIGPALRLDHVIPPLLFPTQTFRGNERLTIDGVELELCEAPGETRDHLFLHLPEDKTVIAGDNIYHAFPNLYSVRGVPPRPVREWSESLDKIRWLRPEYIALGHTEPIIGGDRVQEILTAYRDAIAFLHATVVRLTNQGFTPDEMLRFVRLPDHLREHPYLEESYGCLEWGVRGIYEGYLGWFDGNATNLHPLSPPDFAERIIALAGGCERMEESIQAALDGGDSQWAAQLCDILRAQPGHNPLVPQWKAEALEQLAASTPQPVAKNFYLATAAELRGSGNLIRKAPIGGQTLKYVPLDMLMQALPLQLRTEQTANMHLRIGFVIPDANRTYTFYVRRGVGEVRPDILDEPDFTVRADEADLKALISGVLHAAQALLRGRIHCSAGLAKLRLLRSILHPA